MQDNRLCSKGRIVMLPHDPPSTQVGSPSATWPGVKNEALLAGRKRHVAQGVFSSTPIFAARGRGAYLEDVDGNVYLDFAAGIGVLAVGYSHPKVVRAVQEQAERFLHTAFSVVMYEGYVELARRLAALTPGAFPKKTVFLNSGAEAVENAVKIARTATGRPAVVTFQNGFHGRTLLTMSMTGKIHPYREGFGPFVPEVYHAPFPYVFRYPGTEEACIDAALDGLALLFRTQVSPQSVAAIVVEPVQGEGGFVVAPPRFLQALEAVCRAHGILLVADEIQTGFGRTGKMFAVEHAGVVPDIVIISKALAAGLPLSATVGRAEVMDSVHVGGLGGTYGGNPVTCAAALAVLDVIAEERLVERARALGELMRPRLERLRDRFSLLGDVRGLGPMLAIELVRDQRTKEPAARETGRVLEACLRRGLIVIRAGLYDNVVRIHVPLIISDEDVERGLGILEEAIAEVSAGVARVG
jgi:4-aminobutyrate aminotransferase/(S)-3-amino-2-methylpropionate transaminase